MKGDYENARKAIHNHVLWLKWLRQRRGARKPNDMEYVAESRFIVDLDELRKAINSKQEKKIEQLLKQTQISSAELYDELLRSQGYGE